MLLRRLQRQCVQTTLRRGFFTSTSDVEARAVQFPLARAHGCCCNTQDVVIALGSNVGDRESLLSAALRALPAAGVHPTACSALYETAAAYVTHQACARRVLDSR